MFGTGLCLAFVVGLGVALDAPVNGRTPPWRAPRARLPLFVPSRAKPDAAALAMALARSLRAGLSLPTAFDEAARSLDAPTAALVAPLIDGLQRGAHLSNLLERWPEVVDSPDVRSIASVLEAGHQLGGVTARVLDEAADAIAERDRIRTQVRTQGTTARWSALVVAFGPVAGVLVAAIAEPDALGFLLGGWPGRVCLGVGLGLDALGAWWLNRIGSRVVAQW